MIPGRFNKSYAFLVPSRSRHIEKFRSAFRQIIDFFTHILFSSYFNSNFRVHLHDLFLTSRNLDPFDDNVNRYVVVLYKYELKRKQIVPTRQSASSTLRGAQKLARKLSEQTGLERDNFYTPGAEYILIQYISIGEDLMRYVSRHHLKTRNR